MEKYELYEQSISILTDCITDLRNLTPGKKLESDYKTLFCYTFLHDHRDLVKSEIMEVVGYKNIPTISDVLEVIWQNVNGVEADPLRAHRGFSISRKDVIKGMEYLKDQLTKAIENHKEVILKDDTHSFLGDLIFACKILQGNVSYYSAEENTRNDYIRDLLEFKGYIERDQSRHGRSGTGKKSGEVDLIICNTSVQDKIIVEGLNLGNNESHNSKQIIEHYKKLLERYDTNGNRFNVLLSYVTSADFPNAVLNYKHLIEDTDVEYPAGSVKVEPLDESSTISVLKSIHNRNLKEFYTYHVLVQIQE